MKKNILLFSIPFLVLVTLLVLAISLSNEIESKTSDIENIQKELQYVSSDLNIEKLFSNDLKLANNELKIWLNRGTKQTNFWNEFIQKEANIVLAHSPQSSSSVNTEITKLISYLRRTFDNRNIKLGISQTNEPFLAYSNPEKEKKYGFGFSAYDGFWPSFDKKEANVILMQAKIIKEICDFLLGSFDPGETFTLISIKREAAGKEDLKHIGENLYQKNNLIEFLQGGGMASSFIFEISFLGKSKNCRTFINQLRAPYSLRNLHVSRQGRQETDNRINNPVVSGQDNESNILPIIRDITSKFILEVEYVYDIKSSLNQEIYDGLISENDRVKVDEILNQFN
tara:strand:- start:9053 stop:10075 length:1023 start_codon:yes stop_codon:yes gene_type:complete